MSKKMSATSSSDPDSRNLQVLLEAFGSRFSLEDIASAYCHASHNVDAAGEILFAKTGDMSNNDEVNANSTALEPTSDSCLQNSYQGDRRTRVLRPKKCSVSVGTVAGIIGKDYVRARPLVNAPREVAKPVKIDSKDIPITEIWSEEIPPRTKANNSRMQTDVEEFLLKMLGEGFQVDSAVIREVLDACGYDVQKRMEELLGLSSKVVDFPTAISKQGPTPHLEQLQLQDFAKRDEAKFMTSNLTDSHRRGKDAVDLPREVLEALFTVPDLYEEKQEKISMVKPVRRFGEPVSKPFEEPTWERVVSIGQPQEAPKDDDDENGYETLRKAVNEHWNTMKEYYKAAVEAFVNGDHKRADRLMEKGHFFKLKAREADEKSMAKLVEARENPEPASEEEEIMSLDMHLLEPKEALRLLKVHLSSFSGIPSFKYLRITVGTNEEDAKGARKRLMVKLLEKESIEWIDEDNGLKMLIHVNMINPKNLSFAKKS